MPISPPWRTHAGRHHGRPAAYGIRTPLETAPGRRRGACCRIGRKAPRGRVALDRRDGSLHHPIPAKTFLRRASVISAAMRWVSPRSTLRPSPVLAVVAPAFVVERRVGSVIALLDQAGCQHALDRAVERSRAHLHLTLRHQLHLLHDGVAVFLIIGQRQQDVEDRRGQGEEGPYDVPLPPWVCSFVESYICARCIRSRYIRPKF